MILTVNGKNEDIPEKISISEFLKIRRLKPDAVVVELNRDIIETGNYGTVFLNENDTLEVLKFVGGG